VHPLVDTLSHGLEGKATVTGIFESSILACLPLLAPYNRSQQTKYRTWGIVTTGKFWEDHLTAGVKAYLGQEPGTANSKFAGVFSTGLNAGDFHGDMPKSEIDARLKDAAKKLLQTGKVGCVVMGCAGMAGLEQIIRTAAIEEYGEQRGGEIKIVDGVRAAIVLMESTLHSVKLF